MSLVKERYKAKERTRGMPFNGNNSDVDLSKLVTRGWCWVWFSFKPLPQSEGSTAQRLTLLLEVFELEKKGNWSFDWKQMSGEMGLARNRLGSLAPRDTI